MSDTLQVIVSETEHGFQILSPAVGRVYDLPLPGTILNCGACIGTIRILSQKIQLCLPPDVGGVIADYNTEHKEQSVGFEQQLFNLTMPKGQLYSLNRNTEQREAEDNAKLVIQSPSDGIFYRRPSPDHPCYVEVGTEISSGRILGLVEVMKCFTQITYGGPDLPEKARIKEICAGDAGEVKYRQPLFVLEAS